MSDAEQKHIDSERGLADARASLRRYETYEELPARIPQPPQFARLTSFEDFLEMWKLEDERRKQIEREEKEVFNRKYNYHQ